MSKPFKKFNVKAKAITNELDFCGLWRQAEHEDHKFLMNVVEWRLGNSMNAAREDKLWIRAEVTKHEEGRIFPRFFIMVLPRKGMLFRADTVYAVCKNTDYPFIIEFSGDVFGPSPLYRAVPDTVHLTDSSVYTDREKEAFEIPAGVSTWSQYFWRVG